MTRNGVNIPLVRLDASKEETILQIAFALESVETFVKTVFKNVEEGLTKEKNRLQDIRNRCQIAKGKIEKIKGIHKSIQVFSSSKYPVPENDMFFKLFNNSFVVKEPDIKTEPPPPDPVKNSLKERSKFYHVKDSLDLIKKSEESACYEGLGPIPDNVKSITSLILFNTEENVYKQYKIIDPLLYNYQTERLIKKEEELDIEPAPASIMSKEPFGSKYIPNYFYTPISQVVPDLQAPLDLPFLKGVADDLRFDEDIEELKPQQSTTSGETEKNNILVEKLTLVQNLPKVDSVVSVSSSDVLVSPPPPPPPPPPPLPSILEEPVVPDTTPEIIKSSETLDGPKSGGKPPPITDMRANLMEAIRNAGGKPKLTINAQTIITDTSSATSSTTKKPMSLMDDLHDKLMRRRKGISGKLDSNEGTTILDKVATLIPPPPTKAEETEEEEDNEEWDD